MICRNVPIARIGVQDYTARELQIEGAPDPDAIYPVVRYPDDVFEAAALASFEGKPVTDGHPAEEVVPENHSCYARGHAQNVRRDGDYMVADLYINDPALISEIRAGVKREVSCGYCCRYVPDGAGYRQTHIRGNHVAVVPRGRAGREVAIHDAAPEADERSNTMSKLNRGILALFGRAAKDAKTDAELDAMVEAVAPALDAAEAAEPAAAVSATAQDAAPAAAPAGDIPTTDAKLDRLIEMIGALLPKQTEQTAEQKLDAMLAKLGVSDGSTTITADADTVAHILRSVRPAIAAIEDGATRARVADALLAAVAAPDQMGDILGAAASSAKKAADAAPKKSVEQICADQQAAYDALNPHKKNTNKED